MRFISVQDQIETNSPMGEAVLTIISAMTELESGVISERVTTGMRAAKNRGKRLGRPKIRPALVAEIERLASSTNLSVRQIHQNLSAQASRGFICEITKRARAAEGFSLASQAV